jgi:hypothetical protein
MKIKNPTFKLSEEKGYQAFDSKGRNLFDPKIIRRVRCHMSFKQEMQPREQKSQPRWFNLADKIN